MVSNSLQTAAVSAALSVPRMSTYVAVCAGAPDSGVAALELYAWNAAVSAAMLAPLHVCEVVMRNAVADVLELVYTEQWPWSQAFERSLPDPVQGYSPRRDLQAARRSANTAGAVIPELKFVFWQKMFTSRYDSRLWGRHLLRVLPNLDGRRTVSASRESVYADLEQLRKLRNRIAHHEPIFARDLTADLQKIVELVRFRCAVTAQWMCDNQQVDAVIAARPTVMDLPHERS